MQLRVCRGLQTDPENGSHAEEANETTDLIRYRGDIKKIAAVDNSRFDVRRNIAVEHNPG